MGIDLRRLTRQVSWNLHNPRFDVLARQAGFRSQQGDWGIRGPYGHSVDWIVNDPEQPGHIYPEKVYYKWSSNENLGSKDRPEFSDLEIVTSETPKSNGYSTAKRYLIKGDKITGAYQNRMRSPDLTQTKIVNLTPTNSGYQVLELLKSYVLEQRK